jgi:hypothetical protein
MMQKCQPNHYVMQFRSSHFNSSYMALVVSAKITNRRRPVAKFLVWNQKKASIGLLFSDRSTRNLQQDDKINFRLLGVFFEATEIGKISIKCSILIEFIDWHHNDTLWRYSSCKCAYIHIYR